MKKTRWILQKPDQDGAKALAGTLAITPVLAQLLINRGLREPGEAGSFLRGTREHLHDPLLLAGMEKALQLIRHAIDRGWSIRVFGDYDADGVTSTVVLLSTLRRAGARADYYIPHRIEEGYGLSFTSIEKASREGIGLIITVDCGVSDLEPIALAGKLGMTVVVTDHHQVPEELPAADAIINPRQRGCPYPFKSLAGVGVAFKLVQALHASLGLPFPADYFDLVALGTIADVVPLTGENRIFVKEGLPLLRKGMRPGIAALRDRVTRRPLAASVKDISFNIIPPLNAAGRMERAALAVELLLCQGEEEAAGRAVELEELNRERQRVEERIRKEALMAIEKKPGEHLEGHVVVIAREGWNAGVLGISAARIAARLGKPVFLIALRDGKGRGSARSAAAVDIFELMKGASDLFLNYGGHAGAGGFDIREENIPLLKQRLEEQLALPAHTRDSAICREVDMEIPLDAVTPRLVEEIQSLEPHGEGNPEPLFMLRGITLRDLQTVGGEAHLKLKLAHQSFSLEGIAFNQGALKNTLLHEDLLYDVVMVPEFDTYRGGDRLNGRVLDIHYPDMNSSLLVSAPHQFFSPGEGGYLEIGNDPVPMIINSRNIRNRIQYLKGLAAHTCSAVILARTMEELKKVASSLEREGIEAAIVTPNGERPDPGGLREKGLILSFPRSVADLGEREDVLFLSPPPSIEHFAIPWYRPVKRIHFLFNHHHLEREERLQSVMELTPEKLDIIIKAMGPVSGEGFFGGDPEKIVRTAQHDQIKKITVELAFRLLKELSLPGEAAGRGGWTVPHLARERLECSRLFTMLREERASFTRFRLLYTLSFEGLKKEILAAISGAPAGTCTLPAGLEVHSL